MKSPHVPAAGMTDLRLIKQNTCWWLPHVKYEVCGAAVHMTFRREWFTEFPMISRDRRICGNRDRGNSTQETSKGSLGQWNYRGNDLRAPSVTISWGNAIEARCAIQSNEVFWPNLTADDVFLYRQLEEDIQMKVPVSLNVEREGSTHNSVKCKFKKTLYGFNQAPRC